MIYLMIISIVLSIWAILSAIFMAYMWCKKQNRKSSCINYNLELFNEDNNSSVSLKKYIQTNETNSYDTELKIDTDDLLYLKDNFNSHRIVQWQTNVKVAHERALKNNYNSLELNPPDIKGTLSIFCHVQQFFWKDNEAYVKVIPPNTVKVIYPNSIDNYRTETHHKFKNVFNQSTSKRQLFKNTLLDLVKILIKGKNGALFAYRTKDGHDVFINSNLLSQCADVIFSSIHNRQTKRYTFIPDKLNGFKVIPELHKLLSKNRKHTSIDESSFIYYPKTESASNTKRAATPVPKEVLAKIHSAPINTCYAVFVNYVLIYNNYAYDLLEDTENVNQRLFKPKTVVKDSNHNIYVQGITEIEVKSSNEFMKVFNKGEKQRHSFSLKGKDLDSHSIFTVRLVQTTFSSQRNSLLINNNMFKVSQLSLVDLATITLTTKNINYDEQLLENASLSDSLTSLRTCFEILKENLANGANKPVPCENFQLTHIFKNYFNGNGHIRMIVCINPCLDNFQEILQALKFCEKIKELKYDVFESQNSVQQLPSSSRLQSIDNTKSNFTLDAPIHGDTVCSTCSLDKHDWSAFITPKFPDLTKNTNNKLLIETIESRMVKSAELNEHIIKMANQIRLNLSNIKCLNEDGKLSDENKHQKSTFKGHVWIKDLTRKLNQASECKKDYSVEECKTIDPTFYRSIAD